MQPVPLALKVFKAPPVRKDCRELLVFKVLKAFKELQDQQVHKELQVFKASKARIADQKLFA